MVVMICTWRGNPATGTPIATGSMFSVWVSIEAAGHWETRVSMGSVGWAVYRYSANPDDADGTSHPANLDRSPTFQAHLPGV